ncbi:uncharacterized protein LOC142987894 isoform X2 [Anticarsia gemmatalis]|uniref:uncharacterized protein LOC142987894 isoform X2 n=1 Tax=Anticarsia gemmatalis TaxID=129554 RepID=UPI003F7690E8
MGGAVSSGRDNNELIDNLMGGNYIRSHQVERVFRALDRADYMTPEARDQAYKDLAWRNGPLHLSAPCIYSEVLEGLELRPGLSFLNVGSGTGYFSTMVGLVIGSSGINHGVEVHPSVLEYSIKKLSQFIENSPTLDEFDFCEPKFYGGNGLCLAPLSAPYDRVYCGAGCPVEYNNYFKQLIKVDGILVMPLNENLVQIKRTSEDGWSSKILLNVSFATLRVPTKDETNDLIKLDEQCPPRLQLLCRSVIRAGMRSSLLARHPQLRPPPPRREPGNPCPRRICIPIEDDSDVEGLNALHDLDNVNGANEMNALLSLVLSMGQNRVAGALRFDSVDSDDSSTDDENPNGGGGGGGDDDDGRPDRPPPPERPLRVIRRGPPSPDSLEQLNALDNNDDPIELSDGSGDEATRPVRVIQLPPPIRTHRGLLTFEFRDDDDELNAIEGRPNKMDTAETAATETKGKAETAGTADTASTTGTTDTTSPTGTADTAADKATPPAGPKQTDGSNGVGSTNEGKTTGRMRGVPAEVEICLGKQTATTSSTDLFWEPGSIVGESSTDEEGPERPKEKRKKLDSGIGEGTTTSSGSSPGKTDPHEGDESGHSDDNIEDEVHLASRRRRQKRNRCAMGAASRSSSSASGGASGLSAADEGAGGAARRRKRRAHERAALELRPRRGLDARRVRLSVLMKRGVKDLPLPYALKKYVNLGRCFEF